MDKQDFAQIKRQQEASTGPSEGHGRSSLGGGLVTMSSAPTDWRVKPIDYNAESETYNWRGLANERPLPPFGAMSVSMARQFNRKLLDERFPLGNEKPVKGLRGASLQMLRPGSAQAPSRRSIPQRRSMSASERMAKATSSLLDKYGVQHTMLAPVYPICWCSQWCCLNQVCGNSPPA